MTTFKCSHPKTWANTVLIGQYQYERCRKCWNESMRRAYHARKKRKEPERAVDRAFENQGGWA